MTGLEIIHDFPGYDVVEAPMVGRRGCRELKAGDRIALADDPMRHYQMGSVASYALERNDCPIAAIERAKANRHELHFAFALATCISNPPPPKGRYIGVRFDEDYYFEGRLFRFVPAPNRNLKMVEVTA